MFLIVNNCVSYPILDGEVCVFVDVDFGHGDSTLLFGDGLFQPRAEDFTGAAPSTTQTLTNQLLPTTCTLNVPSYGITYK